MPDDGFVQFNKHIIEYMRGVYVLLLISLLGYAGRVSGQESVTITQCYEWARANYPQIHQMGLIDQTERYSLSNVGKAWLPQLSVSGKASYQSDVTKLPLDGDKISSLLPGFEIPSLSKDQYQVVAQVDQTIWDGGSTRSARALTRAEAIANREQLESELYALNDRVNQIYFGCLLQDELIRQNALLQKELQVNIERIKAMMDNGVANQSDLESMEVELLNARQNEIELRSPVAHQSGDGLPRSSSGRSSACTTSPDSKKDGHRPHNKARNYPPACSSPAVRNHLVRKLRYEASSPPLPACFASRSIRS